MRNHRLKKPGIKLHLGVDILGLPHILSPSLLKQHKSPASFYKNRQWFVKFLDSVRKFCYHIEQSFYVYVENNETAIGFV